MKQENWYLSTIDEKAEQTAKRCGLGLEIAEYCTAWNLDEKFAETDPLVREKLTYADRFVLHAPFNELFPCAIDPKARELARSRYREALALAVEYGAKKVVIHGGYNPWLYYPVWYVEQSQAFWREFAAEIPEGITVCLENVLEETPDMLGSIVRGADCDKIRMCLDVGHVNAYSKVPVMKWLEDCADCISHFHIHNNDGSWDTHSALGTGTIPMKELLDRAEVLCPDATYTLELTDAEPSVKWLMEE